eukprot:1161379-Pyramimonas_sp.AAC.2
MDFTAWQSSCPWSSRPEPWSGSGEADWAFGATAYPKCLRHPPPSHQPSTLGGDCSIGCARGRRE